MSFVTQYDVFAAVEPVIRGVFQEFSRGRPVTKKFPLIPYAEALRKYGTDKPDLRNPIEMADVSDHFRGSQFRVFANMLASDPEARVWAIPARGGGSRAFCDRMDSWAKGEGQAGLGYIFWRENPQATSEEGLMKRLRALARGKNVKKIIAVSGGSPTAEVGVQLSEIDFKLLSIMLQRLRKAHRLEEAADLFSKYFEGAGPLARNLGTDRTEAIRTQLNLNEGDAAFFLAGRPGDFVKFAGPARTKVGEELGLIQKDRFELCWIVDFPMYEWNEEDKKIDFSHNPFSMPNLPVDEFLALDAADHKKILSLKAIQYDIVCNGVELSSGAIRNHRPDVMKKAFAIAGYDENTLEQKFGGMLHALSLGAPPHGGIAPGIDRIVMLLCGEENLREVVLFPMNQRAEDLMMGAPAEATPKQLRELHIRVVKPE
jgi:aspartyl-tRNA synthetase